MKDRIIYRYMKKKYRKITRKSCFFELDIQENHQNPKYQ